MPESEREEGDLHFLGDEEEEGKRGGRSG